MKDIDNFSSAELRLIDDVRDNLIKIQKFFKNNRIGKAQGERLIQGFITFTFSGNSAFKPLPSDPFKTTKDSAEIKEKLKSIDGLSKTLRCLNVDVITDLYSKEEDHNLHIEMIRSAFVNQLINVNKLSKGEINGTIGVFSCLAVLPLNEDAFTETVTALH